MMSEIDYDLLNKLPKIVSMDGDLSLARVPRIGNLENVFYQFGSSDVKVALLISYPQKPTLQSGVRFNEVGMQELHKIYKTDNLYRLKERQIIAWVEQGDRIGQITHAISPIE